MVAANINLSLGPTLSEEQARAIVAQGEEAAVFALLQLAKMLAEQQTAQAATSHQTPATPSGMKPPFAKPTSSGRKKKPGRKQGHLGSRRAKPERIDAAETHRADACPECGGPLCRCGETRTRYIEDIPEVQPVVTEHTIHRDWCPSCRKKVEPKVSAALPNSSLGTRMLVLTAWHDAQAKRLLTRLQRHRDDLFTFLDQPGVPFENNLADRSTRPAVIIRKNSYGNRSDRGADVQAVLMSIFFTLKKRGHNPVNALHDALTMFLKTSQLPPLPTTPTAIG